MQENRTPQGTGCGFKERGREGFKAPCLSHGPKRYNKFAGDLLQVDFSFLSVSNRSYAEKKHNR